MTTLNRETEHRTGRELDAEIHLKVMGATWPTNRCRVCGWVITGIDPRNGCTLESCSFRPVTERRADAPPRYTTDLVTAMRVIEMLAQSGWAVVITNDQERTDAGWEVEFNRRVQRSVQNVIHEAVTLPEAICHAALEATDKYLNPRP